MAGEIIRPTALPDRPNPVASEKLPVDNGSTVAGATIKSIVEAGRPAASQLEAETGTDPSKAMTPLTTAQAIDARVPGIVNPIIDLLGLGDLATKDKVNDSDWSGTDLSITNGGTGASTAAAARTNLGVPSVAEAQALAQAVVPIYATAAGMPALEVPSGINAIWLNGRDEAGDGNAGLYVQVGAEPGHSQKFQSGDGRWFEKRNASLEQYAAGDSLFFTPEMYGVFPGGTKYTVLLAPGAKDPKVGNFNRSIGIGAEVFQDVVNSDRNEAIGNGALQHMRYGERNTMVGTIAGQWLGTNDPVGTGHLFWNYQVEGVRRPPGDPLWNYSGFETRNPGIGQKLADWFATAPWGNETTHPARNIGIGRDAFNGTINAESCTALGYRALASGIDIAASTAVGKDALRDGIFLQTSVGVGADCGTLWQEGERNVLMGYNAGANAIRGGRNTIIGAYAGYNYTDLSQCIFIGHGGGNQLGNPVQTGTLAIGVVESTPLISGNMLPSGGTGVGPNLGINIAPANIEARLHVRTSSVPSAAALNATGRDFLVETNGSAGMTIRSASANNGSIFFADAELSNIGGVIYSHAANSMTLRVDGANRIIFTKETVVMSNIPVLTVAPAAGSKQIWADSTDGNRLKFAA